MAAFLRADSRLEHCRSSSRRPSSSGWPPGALNVAINTQASEIERARGRPTMSSFHGFFSLGALVGASLGGAIIAARLRQDGTGAAVAAVTMLVASRLFASRSFLAEPPAAATGRGAGARRFALPSAAVLGLAVLTFFSNTVEGAVNDWSALYLSTVARAERRRRRAASRSSR